MLVLPAGVHFWQAPLRGTTFKPERPGSNLRDWLEGLRTLGQGLKDIFQSWIQQGVHILRVDNPQAKPFLFGDAAREHPMIGSGQ